MKSLARACVVLFTLKIGAVLQAQLPAELPGNLAVATSAQRLSDAVTLRRELAEAIGSGQASVDTSITQLRSASVASGLSLSADADFALGAIDVGQRLLVLKKPVEAAAFFAGAETALAAVVQSLPDSSAAQKAMYLEQLARIQLRYLNKRTDGKATLAAALKLQPDDANLRRFADNLLRDKAEIVPTGKNSL